MRPRIDYKFVISHTDSSLQYNSRLITVYLKIKVKLYQL